MRMHRLLLIVISSHLLSCVISPPVLPDDPQYAPVIAPPPAPLITHNGSLFRPTASLNLFSDRVARNIGDILTVILQENTSSNKSNSIGINKESDVTVPGAGLILGKDFDYGTSLSSGSDFKGGGNAAQSNNLSGNIAVSIVDIWPNGTLVIRGEKWLTLNKGKEFIRVNGLVRPDDISPKNTVMSTKVANARITYSGTGQMASSQRMGWITRFFNSSLWPL